MTNYKRFRREIFRLSLKELIYSYHHNSHTLRLSAGLLVQDHTIEYNLFRAYSESMPFSSSYLQNMQKESKITNIKILKGAASQLAWHANSGGLVACPSKENF